MAAWFGVKPFPSLEHRGRNKAAPLLADEEGVSQAEQLIAEAADIDEIGATNEPDVNVPLEKLAGSKERFKVPAIKLSSTWRSVQNN